MKKTSLLIACTLATILSGCGGGSDSTSEIEVSAFQATQERRSIAGYWPQASYTIFDRQSWEAAWAERRAALNCTQSSTSEACSQVEAPPVDFSTSVLVGTTLGRNFTFPSNGKTATARKDGDVLTVEFLWEQLTSPIPEGTPAATNFWIVKAKARTVVVKPAGAA